MLEKAAGGDQGQRYEVWAKTREGSDVRVGWTNDQSGGGIRWMILQSPDLHTPDVRDRFPGIDQLIHFSHFKAGCRKCVSDVYAGQDHCRYCSTVFPMRHTALAKA